MFKCGRETEAVHSTIFCVAAYIHLLEKNSWMTQMLLLHLLQILLNKTLLGMNQRILVLTQSK